MHGKQMRYVLVAAGALAVGFLLAGTPVQSLLPIVLLLACPLMMILMTHARDVRPQDHKITSGA